MLVSSLMQTGYVAVPDCFSTFGLLGAVGSATTVHFACPLPVWLAVHPPGGLPGSAVSNVTVSDAARDTAAKARPATKREIGFMSDSSATFELYCETSATRG